MGVRFSIFHYNIKSLVFFIKLLHLLRLQCFHIAETYHSVILKVVQCFIAVKVVLYKSSNLISQNLRNIITS